MLKTIRKFANTLKGTPKWLTSPHRYIALKAVTIYTFPMGLNITLGNIYHRHVTIHIVLNDKIAKITRPILLTKWSTFNDYSPNPTRFEIWH